MRNSLIFWINFTVLVYVCLAVLYFILDEYHVPNNAVLKITNVDQDTIPVEAVALPFKYDAYHDGLGVKFESQRTSETIISLDSLDVLTIYNPNITVIWDTLR